jgi:hypothetical protein
LSIVQSFSRHASALTSLLDSIRQFSLLLWCWRRLTPAVCAVSTGLSVLLLSISESRGLPRSCFDVQDRSDGHHGAVGDGCRWPQWRCRLLLPIQKSTPVVVPVSTGLVPCTNGHIDTVGCCSRFLFSRMSTMALSASYCCLLPVVATIALPLL